PTSSDDGEAEAYPGRTFRVPPDSWRSRQIVLSSRVHAVGCQRPIVLGRVPLHGPGRERATEGGRRVARKDQLVR
ncbi:MAG TPA: hypothetical protein VJN70_11460, partial [Gemmatimonadaceae bacterium]|nr:hypothetical protein [Gemmatimonadaceae bacterium]